jgi:hypothetical protein
MKGLQIFCALLLNGINEAIVNSKIKNNLRFIGRSNLEAIIWI